MKDELILRDLEFPTHIGITAEERADEQTLLITLEMPTDAAATAATDGAPLGLDYAAVREAVLGLSQTERNTIERLAEDIAALLLGTFALSSVAVTVKKFPFADTASAELRITRP